MKKRRIVSITIIILCFISGCKINNPIYYILIQDNKQNSNCENINTLEEKLFEEQNENVDVKIKYPQIKIDENPMAEEINKIIEKVTVNKYYKDWDWVWDSDLDLGSLSLEQKYEVGLHNKKLLSIIFYQYSYVKGAAHPNDNCYAITINLQTAEKLPLSNFVKSYKCIENNILNNNYEILCGALQAMNADEIIKFIHGEFEDIPISENKNNFYISEDENIYIIIDLPQSAGGYSVIKIGLR